MLGTQTMTQKRINWPSALIIAIALWLSLSYVFMWPPICWETPSRKTCISNLRSVESAKEQWALEHDMTNGTIASEEDLRPYSKGGIPICYETGITLSINPIGVNASCPGSANYPVEPGVEKKRTRLFFWHWKIKDRHELATYPH